MVLGLARSGRLARQWKVKKKEYDGRAVKDNGE